LDVERFHLKKPNGMEVRTQYQIKMSNRCAALEKFHSEDINRACENIKENIKISAKDSLLLV
jgi:hypothetical protein